ncbi:hypothetical protein P0D88_34910 [Paraburkholderia sp. RL18-103-BIB-C]|uniref:hypothetical protein n=1 Tax=Paraburkholderia sp. RL18-103-BIB-C TaxID=3031637 RepID=UPI0038BC2B06
MNLNPVSLTAGARLAEFERLLRACRLTSRDAADTLGLTYESIRGYQRGSQAPSGPAMVALAALAALPSDQREALIVRHVRMSRAEGALL